MASIQEASENYFNINFIVHSLVISRETRVHESMSFLVFEPPFFIPCEELLEDVSGFLHRNISNYVCEHDLQQLASQIISYTHYALQNTAFETETKEARIIPLFVNLPLITLDGSETQNLIEIGGEDSNLLTEIMEQSMQQLNMIPTSKKAIASLKKLETLNDEMKANKCSICMEGFEEDFGDVSAMQCNHFYHHNCIVTWLETNHICPLCRFQMPTE
ncbi:hypothetical protein QN277_000957 [Acacia crassicarpa]|uniref:RING-type E3 ubiquitin transferase n=1 Tax=Acacia crassicarpa TaxID=499986 RepID=A0AAE1N7L3_9FABA|nr:hypothetical protein QN277_000957 [Acacia crassicarpa]